MNLETTGEISVAIPVIFSLLLLFLFLFLFTTRNFSLKQTFTPAAVVLFSIYTAVVIGLWGFFLNQKRSQHQESGTQPLLPAAMTDSIQADFSDEIIIHNDTLPIPTRYSHLPKDATPIPDFNYRQDIVPRTIAERLHHFRQIHDIEKRRKNMLELEE